MAKRDNFFALLDDDDEGVDLMTLVARAEAKAAFPASALAVPAVATDGVAAKQSQRPSAGRMERERGKGGRYQRGTRGPRYEEANGNGVEGQPMDGFTRVYQGHSAGHGGRGRGRGGGSRGRGRGFYVERTFGNESHFHSTQNQGQNVDANGDVTEGQRKDGEYRSNRPTRYEKGDGESGNENQNSGFEENQGFRTVERRNYGGNNRPFRAGRSSGGNRGFSGGEYRDENGHQHARRGYGNGNHGFRGEVPRYVPRNEVQDEGEKVKKNENAEEVKEDAVTGNDLMENNANNGETESGWDMTEATEPVADGKTENANSNTTAEEDRQRKMEADEEAKKMTLVEYEKLLQEKRKALEAMRSEAKRVVDEKEFEGMQIVEKKKEEEHFIKLKMDKEKQKKKEGAEKDEKARKSLSINVEYYGGRGRGRGRGQRGGYRAGNRLLDAPKIEDASQFPVLGQAVKA